MENNIIVKSKEYLKQKFSCHSIILYGSFVDGSYNNESDIDIICFSDNKDSQNDTSMIEGWQLDAWIYNTVKMEKPEELLRINEGKIILDEKNLCEKLLQDINKFFNKGSKKLTLEEIAFQKNWLKKMLKRSKLGDIEGNFRYYWMLVDSLEIYFAIKGLRYIGPKKSLLWLKNNDIDGYKLFDNALKPNSSFEDIEKLINYIVEL